MILSERAKRRLWNLAGCVAIVISGVGLFSVCRQETPTPARRAAGWTIPAPRHGCGSRRSVPWPRSARRAGGATVRRIGGTTSRCRPGRAPTGGRDARRCSELGLVRQSLTRVRGSNRPVIQDYRDCLSVTISPRSSAPRDKGGARVTAPGAAPLPARHSDSSARSHSGCQDTGSTDRGAGRRRRRRASGP